MPKYLVSTTLHNPDWPNTQVIASDPAAAIKRLKESPGKNIVQYGFGPLSQLMLEHGLLDELRLWVHPLILGRGSPGDFFFGPSRAVGFNLVGSTTLSKASSSSTTNSRGCPRDRGTSGDPGLIVRRSSG